MTIDDVNNMNLNAYAVFKALDGKDGKEDGKIMNSIWNEFAPQVGGRTIKNYILEANAVKSIRYYIKRGGEAAVNKICEFLGFNKDTATQNLTKANQMMNDAAQGKVEYTVREYTNDDGTISRVAEFTDGTLIRAIYDKSNNLTKISVSTNPNQETQVGGVIEDHCEVIFKQDKAYIEAEGSEKLNMYPDFQVTQGYDFNEYKDLADKIFAKGVTTAVSANENDKPLHLNIENSPTITAHINGATDFLEEMAAMEQKPEIKRGKESDNTWKTATLPDGRCVWIRKYNDNKIIVGISNDITPYHEYDGTEFDGAEISYTFNGSDAYINVRMNHDKRSPAMDCVDIKISDANFEAGIMALVKQIFGDNVFDDM